MADEAVRALDATDATQILVCLRDWINSLTDPDTAGRIIPEDVGLETYPGKFGFCIKGDGGEVTDEDIEGNFTAEVPFMMFYKTNAVADGSGEIFKPLNDLAAWFRKNGPAGLNIGTRRTPDEIITLKGPTDLAGEDEDGSTTFFSVHALTYDEEVS